MIKNHFHSVERQFEVRDLALARLEGEKERGGEVQVGYFGDILPEQFQWNNLSSIDNDSVCK